MDEQNEAAARSVALPGAATRSDLQVHVAEEADAGAVAIDPAQVQAPETDLVAVDARARSGHPGGGADPSPCSKNSSPYRDS